jgi:hypothetical protein
LNGTLTVSQGKPGTSFSAMAWALNVLNKKIHSKEKKIKERKIVLHPNW